MTANIFMFLLFLNAASAFDILANTGETLILPCQTTDHKPAMPIEWTKSDLGSNYVLLYRDHQYDPENQDQSFKDRVALQDEQMKNGDVTLILKNVAASDVGTYECRIVPKKGRGALKAPPICNIRLTIFSHAYKNENERNRGGKTFSPNLWFLLLLWLFFMIYKTFTLD